MDDLISRKAAIEAIGQLNIPEDMCVFEILSHIQLAIGTLPSAQPETHDKRTETHACDLISRQAAIAFVDCGYLRPPTELAWSDKDVVDMLKRLPSAQRWIPVSERLPEDGLYIVTTSKGQVQVHVFSHNGNSEEYWMRCNKAWMPLPEAYKGEKE